MSYLLNTVTTTALSTAIVGFITLTAVAQEGPLQDPLPPQKHVSFATKPLSLKTAYELRKGFHPHAIFPATDYNLYYHGHWSEFIPSHTVSRSGAISGLSYNLNKQVGQATATTELGELSLQEVIKHPDSRIQGFVVVHNGEIIFETYPGMRETDNHIWMSTTKTIVGLLVSQLEEEGLIDVQKPVSAYLDEFKGSNWEHIRIIDILDMTTGLDASETSPSLMNPAHPVHYWQKLVLHGGQELKPMTSRDAILAVPDFEELKAGHLYQYSSLASQVLGFLVEQVLDRRLSDVVTERIWSKMGAEGDATLGLNDAGNAGIFALLSSRLRDKARYGMLYTPSWSSVAQEQVVSQSVIEKIQTGCRPQIYARTKKMAMQAGHWYASADTDVVCNSRQWDAVYKDGDFYKTGSHGQGLYVSPSRNLVVAFFSTSDHDWQDYARAIAKTVVPKP